MDTASEPVYRSARRTASLVVLVALVALGMCVLVLLLVGATMGSLPPAAAEPQLLAPFRWNVTAAMASWAA